MAIKAALAYPEVMGFLVAGCGMDLAPRTASHLEPKFAGEVQDFPGAGTYRLVPRCRGLECLSTMRDSRPSPLQWAIFLFGYMVYSHSHSHLHSPFSL